MFAYRTFSFSWRHPYLQFQVDKGWHLATASLVLPQAGIPIVLVGWHRDVYDIWLRELAAYRPAMYTGSESERQKNESVRRFIEGDTDAHPISAKWSWAGWFATPMFDSHIRRTGLVAESSRTDHWPFKSGGPAGTDHGSLLKY
ncbi:hypothetical protein [Paenibacillus caui]|uniref:hypothetical protein n=1 Tax=Paenibacillus caui TaxID=2873927 RepID=UPI001CA8F9A9|nr:hypothetical protein [Paenibacillus caui]